jgi:hypothetical protein
MQKVFFLVLFACCRESYNAKKEKKTQDDDTERSVSKESIANFTFAFGCDPASGVPANTKLVMTIVDHIKSYFDPEDGQVIVPDCFNAIDAVTSSVALE